MEQRSGEWMQARLGKVGCSRLGDVMAFGRNGAPLKRRTDYMFELVGERFTAQAAEHFHSAAMDRGIEYEPQARIEYETRNGVMVEEHGGMAHPLIADWWGSPDGLVGADGGIEIKCPNTETHFLTITEGIINPDYIYQMAGYCVIFGRAWWDFISFDPRLDGRYGYYQRRFMRDELPCVEIVLGVRQFLVELAEKQAKMEQYDSHR